MGIGSKRRARKGGEDGFAAIDAIVALTILTGTIVLSINAMAEARRAAERALDVRRAQTVLAFLLQTGSRVEGAHAGVMAGFRWRLDHAATDAAPDTTGVGLCRRQASIRSVRTDRVYRAETAELCRRSDR